MQLTVVFNPTGAMFAVDSAGALLGSSEYAAVDLADEVVTELLGAERLITVADPGIPLEAMRPEAREAFRAARASAPKASPAAPAAPAPTSSAAAPAAAKEV